MSFSPKNIDWDIQEFLTMIYPEGDFSNIGYLHFSLHVR